jgi:hypothetical protein
MLQDWVRGVVGIRQLDHAAAKVEFSTTAIT